MAKTANTAELQNAIQNKQQAPQTAPADRRQLAFKQLNNLFERSANELKKVLPATITPERIARVTLTACRKNPALLDCNPNSIIGSVFQAAQLGLEPDLLGSCYLVPYKDQVQLIIGYKGYIDLAYRSPRIISIQAHTVYANDIFKMDNGSQPYLKHEQSEEPTEEVRGFYAIAHLQNGGCLWYYMSKAQIEAHRDKFSSDYKYKKSKGWEKNSVWGQHFESMAKKTVLHQLMTWLPMEIENKEFMAYDGTVRADIQSEPEYIEPEYEILEDTTAAE
jgi:recombination protein RecT